MAEAEDGQLGEAGEGASAVVTAQTSALTAELGTDMSSSNQESAAYRLASLLSHGPALQHVVEMLDPQSILMLHTALSDLILDEAATREVTISSSHAVAGVHAAQRLSRDRSTSDALIKANKAIVASIAAALGLADDCISTSQSNSVALCILDRMAWGRAAFADDATSARNVHIARRDLPGTKATPVPGWSRAAGLASSPPLSASPASATFVTVSPGMSPLFHGHPMSPRQLESGQMQAGNDRSPGLALASRRPALIGMPNLKLRPTSLELDTSVSLDNKPVLRRLSGTPWIVTTAQSEIAERQLLLMRLNEGPDDLALNSQLPVCSAVQSRILGHPLKQANISAAKRLTMGEMYASLASNSSAASTAIISTAGFTGPETHQLQGGAVGAASADPEQHEQSGFHTSQRSDGISAGGHIGRMAVIQPSPMISVYDSDQLARMAEVSFQGEPAAASPAAAGELSHTVAAAVELEPSLIGTINSGPFDTYCAVAMDGGNFTPLPDTLLGGLAAHHVGKVDTLSSAIQSAWSMLNPHLVLAGTFGRALLFDQRLGTSSSKDNKMIKTAHLEPRHAIATFKGRDAFVRACALDSSTYRVAIGGADGHCYIFDQRMPEKIYASLPHCAFNGWREETRHIVLVPGLPYAITACYDGVVRMWRCDVPNHQLVEDTAHGTSPPLSAATAVPSTESTAASAPPNVQERRLYTHSTSLESLRVWLQQSAGTSAGDGDDGFALTIAASDWLGVCSVTQVRPPPFQRINLGAASDCATASAPGSPSVGYASTIHPIGLPVPSSPLVLGAGAASMTMHHPASAHWSPLLGSPAPPPSISSIWPGSTSASMASIMWRGASPSAPATRPSSSMPPPTSHLHERGWHSPNAWSASTTLVDLLNPHALIGNAAVPVNDPCRGRHPGVLGMRSSVHVDTTTDMQLPSQPLVRDILPLPAAEAAASSCSRGHDGACGGITAPAILFTCPPPPSMYTGTATEVRAAALALARSTSDSGDQDGMHLAGSGATGSVSGRAVPLRWQTGGSLWCADMVPL